MPPSWRSTLLLRRLRLCRLRPVTVPAAVVHCRLLSLLLGTRNRGADDIRLEVGCAEHCRVGGAPARRSPSRCMWWGACITPLPDRPRRISGVSSHPGGPAFGLVGRAWWPSSHRCHAASLAKARSGVRGPRNAAGLAYGGLDNPLPFDRPPTLAGAGSAAHARPGPVRRSGSPMSGGLLPPVQRARPGAARCWRRRRPRCRAGSGMRTDAPLSPRASPQ